VVRLDPERNFSISEFSRKNLKPEEKENLSAKTGLTSILSPFSGEEVDNDFDASWMLATIQQRW
jgi:hypothetical protein